MQDTLSSEGKYVISTFEKNFFRHKDKPIAFYGVGANTQILLENIKGYNIVGLMDAQCVGENIFGYKVLSNEDVIKKAEYIVIIARPSVINIIYKRIEFLEKEHNIKIFNVEGKPLNDINEDTTEVKDIEYWKSSEEILKEMIDKHDIISFDIFDTLIMRKILRPQNIFDVVERILDEQYNIKINFKEVRIQAENELNKTIEAPSLNEIYDRVQEIMNIKDEIKKIIKSTELQVEYKYIVPRKKMVEIFNYAKKMRKSIYLLSDMYLPKEEIKILLNKCNINGFNELIISCDIQKTKNTGKMYEYYKLLEKKGDLLHIGDNAKGDIEMAKNFGINTFQVLSSYEMLMNSNIKGILVNVSTIEECNILGLFLAKAFNNPFILNSRKGRLFIDDLFEMSYLFIGPIIFNFIVWLVQELTDSEYEKILFSARDGYLIEKLYTMVINKCNITNATPGLYFKTSRRAISVANISNEEDILTILKKAYKCTKGQLLKIRFGIDPKNQDKEVNDSIVSGKDDNEVISYIMSYKNKILENAKDERECYIEYINNIGIMDKKKVALFDFCSSGTIQHYLAKLINKEIRGFYFATMNIPNGFYEDASKMTTLFGDAKQYYSKFNLCKSYMFLESILTDPNNTLVRCLSDSRFQYNEGETNLKDYNNIDRCHKGIKSFIEDMLSLDERIVFRDINPSFTDDLFGLLPSKRFIVSDKIKNSFYTESGYDFNYEYNVWDTL